MKFSTSSKTPSSNAFDTVIIPLFDDNALDSCGEDLRQSLGTNFEQWLASDCVKNESGSVAHLPIVSDKKSKGIKHVITIGFAKQDTLTPRSFKQAIRAALSTAKQVQAKKILISLADITIQECGSDWSTRYAVEHIVAGEYQFDHYKSKKASKSSLREIAFYADKAGQRKHTAALKRAEAIAAGVSVAKDLGNQPGNVCTPSYLAKQAKSLAAEHDDVSVKVLEEKDMEKLNMGAFLSVSKGSIEPGKLVIINYQGAAKKQQPHVIVGKGITFDTGGISLKPGAAMDEMKYDMCGAASVVGAMTAIATIKPKMNVIGVLACAENMPAGNASKPGDIVTTSSGKTVEILNTDAEGRLVLCDTLTYVERFKPASVVDIATLTGACIMALGHHISAVMTNNQDLAGEIVNAGHQADDKVWQLPLGEEYQRQIDSPFADMQNIGGRGAGTITAGCFLSRFAESYPWAHLDIAGTAWVSGGKDKGATGRPVPLLVQYLMNKINN